MIESNLDIFKYSSIIDSKKLNKHEQDLINELIELFGSLNNLNDKIKENEYLKNIENFYLQRTIAMLYQELQKTTDTEYISIFPSDVSLINNAVLDTNSNTLLMAPLKKENKLFITDPVNDDRFVPDTLVFEINDDASQYIQVIDNDIYNCFDANPWIREITTNNSTSEVYCTLNIYLPYDICSNDLVNEIKFNLFPMDSTEIISVQYSDGYDVSFLRNLDELLYHKGCVINDFEIGLDKKTNNIVLTTEDKSMKIISITLKQNIYVQSDTNRKFYLGLSGLAVNYNSYPTSCEFYYDMDIIEAKSIDNIEFEYNNDYTNEPEISVYSVENEVETLMYPAFAPFTIENKTLRFKFKLNYTGIAPNVKKIKIYSTFV